MYQIKIFKFNPLDYPLNERFEVLDFLDCANDIKSNQGYIEDFYCFLLIVDGEPRYQLAVKKVMSSLLS